MARREVPAPIRMRRVAVVTPTRHAPDVLAAVGDAGVVEVDIGVDPSSAGTDRGEEHLDVEQVREAAVTRGDLSAVAGWTPADAIGPLSERIAPLGGSVVELPPPPGVDVPTSLPVRPDATASRALVETYGTIPYRDVDPAWFAAAAYVVMFGMMFGDVGDGLLLVAGALWLRRSGHGRLARIRAAWSFVLALGISAALFGLLYGEAFGPTGLVPTVWLAPLDEPEALLLAGVGVGAVLLACAYAIGIVNRLREGGIAAALWAPSGIAGAALFVGVALGAGGIAWSSAPLLVAGVVLAVAGLALAAVGLRAEAGPGGAGVAQAGVETFDLALRLGSNVVSFARLAAFGLMHAALASVVWDGTTSLWGAGIALAVAAVVLFLVGHVVAFALEALVAGVQALRLEYYELFSRVFVGEGRPFRPWHVPTTREEGPC